MPITNDELQSFYQFALGVIKNDDKATSMQELAGQWDAQRERDSVNEAIREGLREIEAGGGKPAEEFFAEMDAKFNLSLDG